VDLGFAAIEKRFDDVATKDQLNAVYDLLDKNIHEHERQELERQAMVSQLARHGRWIEQLAEKIKITLHYE
jgi:DNA-binding transcriptional regulator YbjK